MENGEASNTFLGLKECPNAKVPSVLPDVLKGVVQNLKQRTVSLGSDGTSVMVGKIIGVCTLLNREIPYLSLRCVAHKLELFKMMPRMLCYLKKQKSFFKDCGNTTTIPQKQQES